MRVEKVMRVTESTWRWRGRWGGGPPTVIVTQGRRKENLCSGFLRATHRARAGGSSPGGPGPGSADGLPHAAELGSGPRLPCLDLRCEWRRGLTRQGWSVPGRLHWPSLGPREKVGEKRRGQNGMQLSWFLQGPQSHVLPALTTPAEGARVGHKTPSGPVLC